MTAPGRRTAYSLNHTSNGSPGLPRRPPARVDRSHAHPLGRRHAIPGRRCPRPPRLARLGPARRADRRDRRRAVVRRRRVAAHDLRGPPRGAPPPARPPLARQPADLAPRPHLARLAQRGRDLLPRRPPPRRAARVRAVGRPRRHHRLGRPAPRRPGDPAPAHHATRSRSRHPTSRSRTSACACARRPTTPSTRRWPCPSR